MLAKALVLDPRRASRHVGLPLQAIQATATAQVQRPPLRRARRHPLPAPAGTGKRGNRSGADRTRPPRLSAPEETPDAPRSPLQTQPSRTPQPEEYYEVQPGDTLSKIAARFGTTADEIARLNNLADPNRISVGQRLRVR
jgi:LysM repeat protein